MADGNGDVRRYEITFVGEAVVIGNVGLLQNYLMQIFLIAMKLFLANAGIVLNLL